MRRAIYALVTLSLVASTLGATSSQAITQAPAPVAANKPDPDKVINDFLANQNGEIGVPATPGTVPPSLQVRGEYRIGKIKWRRCSDDRTMQCAVFAVPKNWNNPRKGVKNTVFLALRRMPTTARGVKRPTLFMNPGGPGGSGTEMLVDFTPKLRKLLPYYNIVGFDPRGVPNSEPQPRKCVSAPDTTKPTTGKFKWPSVFSSRYNGSKKPFRECVNLNKGPARWVGTKQVVRDLDAMRKAVGDKKLSYLGYSYGTTIGRTYQLMFPNRIRVMILDGVTNPSGVQLNNAQNGLYGASRGWKMLWAALNPAMRSVYTQVEKYLQTKTIAQPDGTATTRFTFWSAVINTARNPDSLKTLPVIICTTGKLINVTNSTCARYIPSSSQGRAAVSKVMQRLAALQKISPLLYLVNCSDSRGLLSNAQAGKWVGRTARYGGPEAASDLMNYLSMCPGFKKGWDPLPGLTKRTRVPTPPLIVNGVGDIATFYRGARQSHQRFVGSRMVTVDTMVHGLSIVRGNKCVDKVAMKYLRTAKLPKSNIKCGKFPTNPFG